MIFEQIMKWIPFGRVPEISTNELSAILNNGAVPNLIDVRTEKEWRTERIHGTVNIPITHLASQLNDLPFELSIPVVVICRSARRSIPAVRVLKEHGYEQVFQLQGGMIAWRNAGFPVQTED
jgi:rhodanese-related sulfurtransferase